MTDNVIPFTGWCYAPIEPRGMLQSIAEDETVVDAFCIITHADGIRTYHSSTPDSNLALRQVEEFKFKLLRGDFNTRA